MNNSSLYCSFNYSILKANNNINIYSIKQNEISNDDNHILFVGLKKIEFIYEKEKEKEERKINIKEIIIIIIKPLITIALILILVGIIIIVIL